MKKDYKAPEIEVVTFDANNAYAIANDAKCWPWPPWPPCPPPTCPPNPRSLDVN